MRKMTLGFLAVSLAAALIFTGCGPNNTDAEKTVFQGTIEAKDVDINAKVPGRIAEMKVEEGQDIKEGDVIAIVDAKDLAAKKAGLVAQASAAEATVKAAQGQAEATKGQLQAAQATYDKAKNGARVQDIAKAQAAFDIANKSYIRVKGLADDGVISQQTLDEAEAKLSVAKEDLNMAKEGARKEDINAAAAQVQAVRAGVAAAESNVVAAGDKYTQALAGIQEIDTYLNDAAIRSPLTGLVSMVNSSKGELVSTGLSIATITNMNDIWVEIQVPETQLSKFKEGQIVKVTVPAYKDMKFEGKIVRINKKPDYAVKKASNENGEFDLVSYGIKVKLSNDEKLLRPGMTAFVDLQK